MKLTVHTAGLYEFDSNGSSTSVNSLGMREMQALAFAKRDAQYLLIKAPPACGKSRALMFIALDKLQHQGIQKVIVAVPQKAIAGSFKNTKLKDFGTDWKVNPKYELCSKNLSESSNLKAVHAFFNDPQASILVCAHPTLINFYNSVDDKHLLDHTLVAIDEFHHVSADEENRLGGVVHSLMHNSSAHIVAMTGSYFRGDRIPVLDSKDESRFEQVVYTYYQQLQGYSYLKKLKLDYVFFDGTWLEGLDMMINPMHQDHNYSTITPQDYLDPESYCFDPDMGKPFIALKTIIYIPNIQASISSGDKHNDFCRVCEILGTPISPDGKLHPDKETGLYHLKTRYGTEIKVANLIMENEQEDTINFLRKVKSRDDVDVIVALNMAKEGFDWPWCEHVIVSGFRSSLTEVVQIIGRATRDCEGKPIAKFTNLVKQPEATQSETKDAVDDLIKAISLSLMMEQVLQPNIKFVPRSNLTQIKIKPHTGKPRDKGEKIIIIDDEKLSPKVKQVLQDDNAIPDLLNLVTQNLRNYPGLVLLSDKNSENNEQYSQLVISKILKEKATTLVQDMEQADYNTLADLVLKYSKTLHNHNQIVPDEPVSPEPPAVDPVAPNDPNSKDPDGRDNPTIKPPVINITSAGMALLDMRKNFINVSELDFSLIGKSSPFGDAYEFASRILTAPLLKEIHTQAVTQFSNMTLDDALQLYGLIKTFKAQNKRNPDLQSSDPYEKRLALARSILQKELKKKQKLKLNSK